MDAGSPPSRAPRDPVLSPFPLVLKGTLCGRTRHRQKQRVCRVVTYPMTREHCRNGEFGPVHTAREPNRAAVLNTTEKGCTTLGCLGETESSAKSTVGKSSLAWLCCPCEMRRATPSQPISFKALHPNDPVNPLLSLLSSGDQRDHLPSPMRCFGRDLRPSDRAIFL